MGSEPTVFSVIMRSVPFVPRQRFYISAAKHQRDLLRQEGQYGGVSQVCTILSAFAGQIMNATFSHE